MELKDKVAIVTGSSRGIGLSLTRLLLDKGAQVAGWSRSETSVDHPGFKNYRVDVGNQEAVDKALQQVQSDFGNVSVLVNNAGLGYEGTLDEMPVEHWQEMFNTNVNGMFYCTRAVLPVMKTLPTSHIISISSVAGTTGISKMAGYCATKFAVRGFSNALFKEVRKFGVKVSCIYPGSVRTNFFDQIDSVELSDDMMMPEDVATTIIHCLESPDNYLVVDVEVRPLRLR